MFKRSDEQSTRNGAGQPHGRLNSILGDSSQMNGTMRIEGAVRIDGEFEGSLTATETIVVGRTGVARADLEAREILVAGRIEGKLIATERVELQEGAHVEGEIHSQNFMIADGVFFNGSCNMIEQGGQVVDTTGAVEQEERSISVVEGSQRG